MILREVVVHKRFGNHYSRISPKGKDNLSVRHINISVSEPYG